jgi:DNA-binding transcriptional LysR family regulator
LDKLSEIHCFLEVAEHESFTRAANRLGITASAASKLVKSLEGRLGVRLFDRTTRRVALTEVGQAYRERVEPVLLDLDEAESVARALSESPRGRLRIGAPMDFGRAYLSSVIAAFAVDHDEIDLEVEYADRFVNLLDEGYDVVVRIGTLADSSLVARRLGPCRRVLCASPAYLSERGEPRDPADLADHTRIAYAYERERSWELRGPRGPVRVHVPTRHRSNNGDLTRHLVLAGQGLALLPTFLVGDDLRAGRLVSVLHAAQPEPIPIQAVYPHRRFLPAKVRAFVDHLAAACGASPEWDRDLDDAPR